MEQVIRYKYTILIAVVVFILSVIPIPEVKPLEEVPLIDKWVHFVMYAALSLAMWLDLNHYKIPITFDMRKLDLKSCLFLIAVPSLFGGLMELIQAYCTTVRSGDVVDFIADIIGALAGTLIGVIIQLLWHRKNSIRK